MFDNFLFTVLQSRVAVRWGAQPVTGGKLMKKLVFGLSAAMVVAASWEAPAEARGIVIDDGSSVELNGCSVADVNCAPTLLPFEILVGGELTRNIYLVGESGYATVYLGSLNSGQWITVASDNSSRSADGYDVEAGFLINPFNDDPNSFFLDVTFGADIRYVGQDDGGWITFRNLGAEGSPGDFEVSIPFRESESFAFANLSPTSRGEGGEFGSFIFQSSVSDVPEPSTWATMLFGFGVAGYFLRRRRRKGFTSRFA